MCARTSAGIVILRSMRRSAVLLLPKKSYRADDFFRAAKRLGVEVIMPGAEVALEGLLSGGELRVLALFDKPDPLDGPFFEETLYVTPSRHPAGVQHESAHIVEQAARALGLSH